MIAKIFSLPHVILRNSVNPQGDKGDLPQEDLGPRLGPGPRQSFKSASSAQTTSSSDPDAQNTDSASGTSDKNLKPKPKKVVRYDRRMHTNMPHLFLPSKHI